MKASKFFSILVIMTVLVFTGGNVFGFGVTFTSGVQDGYNPNTHTPEQPSPSQGVKNWVTNNYAVGHPTYHQIRDYDNCKRDRYFAHTFNNLGNSIVSATLEIGVASNHDNDSITLGFIDQSGILDNTPGHRWTRNIKQLTLNTTPFCPLPPAQNIPPLVLDLSNLPLSNGGTMDLIPILSIKGWLDVLVQDDSPVDYIKLTVEYDGADFGDAPDSTNHTGINMTTYPSGILAHFPTVFDDKCKVPGPKHHDLKWVCLGDWVTAEKDADLMPDQDGITNIDPPSNNADQDKADDGVALDSLNIPYCGQTKFKYYVFNKLAQHGKFYINVFFDFNQDGDWDDKIWCKAKPCEPVSEWAVQNHLVSIAPGMNYLATPAFWATLQAAQHEQMWMRITLSKTPAPVQGDGRGPASGYKYGETEDYLIKVDF